MQCSGPLLIHGEMVMFMVVLVLCRKAFALQDHGASCAPCSVTWMPGVVGNNVTKVDVQAYVPITIVKTADQGEALYFTC